MCTHYRDLRTLLCELGTLGHENWYTGMQTGGGVEDVPHVDVSERTHGGGGGAESGTDHGDPADPDVEKLDLLSMLGKLPPDDLARCIPPYIFNKVRQVSKTAEAAVEEKKLPREFRVNKVWWAASQDSQIVKENYILHKLLEEAPQNNITSIIVPECLKSNGRTEATKLAIVLKRCPALTHLDLSQNRIEWVELYQTEYQYNNMPWMCTSLTHLDLNRCDLHYGGLKKISSILAQWKCEKLAYLDLRDNKLLMNTENNADWKSLLQQFKQLHHLNLSKNFIGNNQMLHIVEGLSMCTTLTHLDMSSNPFGEVGMNMLVPVLSRFTELTHLVLSNTVLCDDGVGCLCGVLSRYTKLLHLNLSSINMTDASLSNLFVSLSNCTSLTHLNLSFNTFGVAGTNTIAVSLCSFPMLADLHLKWTGMDSAGAGHLAEYLPRYPALTHLHIGGNSIGEDGTRDLAKVLPQCTTLLSLDMRCNGIETGARDLVSACLGMTVHKDKFELTLISNHIPQEIQEELENQCRGTKLVLKLTGW